MRPAVQVVAINQKPPFIRRAAEVAIEVILQIALFAGTVLCLSMLGRIGAQ